MLQMGNHFSNTSNITFVLTSCGRFDLLKSTLESFIQFNTYPVKKIIITEDSGDPSVYNYIPEEIKENTEVIINNPKLGQVKSIDFAYSKVDTPYIFHCEDDWEFYRPDFIQDSLTIMEGNPKTLQVWLRSFKHDIAIHSPYHFLNERQTAKGIPFYKVGSNKEDWQGFSFNPGVKRLEDYKLIGSYGAFSSEKQISKYYASNDFHAVILENDAVMHTGFGEHLVDVHEDKKKKKSKRREKVKLIFVATLSLIAGYGISITF